jgi:hypothetical protein
VLVVLVALLVASATVGALPNLHLRMAWAVSAGVVLLVGGYVGSLIHLRRAASGSAEPSVAAQRQPSLLLPEDEEPIPEDERPTAELVLNLPPPPEGLLDSSVGS